MDPDANLAELLQLTQRIGTNLALGHNLSDEIARLIDLVVGLDDWLRRGGFLPQRWRHVSAEPTTEVPVPALTVQLVMEGEVFEHDLCPNGQELARILRELADKIETVDLVAGQGGKLLDVNGNRVGNWRVTEQA